VLRAGALSGTPGGESMVRGVLLSSVAGAILLACGTAAEPFEDVGEARAAIANVPNDVHCVHIVVVGSARTVTKQFNVTPGESSVLSLKGLPIGQDVFQGSAFAEACAAVGSSTQPTWLGEDVTATLVPGVVADVRLVLRRNGKANVTVDFDDEDGVTCPVGQTACGGTCVNLSTDRNNCGACGVVCSGAAQCVSGSCCADDGTACQGVSCGVRQNNCGQTVFCENCPAGRICCDTDQCLPVQFCP
jgi:hypothetical protein